MTESEKLFALLREELKLMHRAAAVLERSLNDCKEVMQDGIFPVEEMDRLELLFSRFARLADFMIQHIFRLISQIDLDPTGTVRDLINQAEKKGLVADADNFVETRILRNQIAYEYVEEVMAKIFLKALSLAPAVLDAVDRVTEYTKRYELPESK